MATVSPVEVSIVVRPPSWAMTARGWKALTSDMVGSGVGEASGVAAWSTGVPQPARSARQERGTSRCLVFMPHTLKENESDYQ